MKVEFEIVKPDEHSSFRFLYQNKNTCEFVWQYHYHPEYELVCVLYGDGTRHVGNHLSMYQNGDLVLIGSNMPHSGFGLNATDPHEEIVVQIRPEVMKQWISDFPEMKEVALLMERSRHGIKFEGKTKKEVTKMLIGLKNVSAFEKHLGMLKVLHKLGGSEEYVMLNEQPILGELIRKHRSRLQKIFTYVENYYQEDIDIQKVADIANISVPSFCNYFKKMTHITYTEFVNRYRIQKACMLLQQDKTISEVCFECGFNNVTYFNKIFKRIVHKTPSDFRVDK
ncbi:AraC family transcriptional regulator [Pedobacter nutrimenti]|jgi:AraC-like DNA-binding protein/mannose-6-phosphate isomerase-like protein (cupin superfamily)|uniref:AraC-like DNA-binding protein n=1 Tax=Pedobacter nutrimenti TaxID=1241337 RepID=A0A318UE78_9SPHI|nr:AraC family transcriptional regulator [Pedobacter nutrimenti]PYF72959.1 AraC-like DNA-binding protein [Pedobacter nutrimenti]